MAQPLTFDALTLPEEAEALRTEVRAFVAETLPAGHLRTSDFGASHDAAFSRALGARGWIGMTWPKRFGGGERSFFERYVVTEELLAAGAPVGAHWIADRQSGPLLLRYGTEEQREFFLPRIIAGECFFSIGMSEPDSGSDLASVRTTGTRVDGGWRVNGTKLWSSHAHRNHYMIALIRTEPQGENRHAGLSQMIVDLKESQGLTIRPIRSIAGEAEFNEVVFEDCFVPDERVVGGTGMGWDQVTSELGYERSGPERFLSAFRVFVELAREVGAEPTEQQAAVLGRLAAHMMTLRKMSISVAGMLQSNANPVVEAALVKELGNNFEKELPEIARLVAPATASRLFRDTLEHTVLHAPAFTIRGGTREILRGMIARGLGLR
jgi:alkylation response protein AidB-like acyl-CoA dehydrogenase